MKLWMLGMITVLRIPYRSVNTWDDLGINGILDLSESSTFENHLAFLVALWPINGILIPPTQPHSAELAHDVVDEMSSRDHNSAVSLAEIHIHNAVEKPSWTRRADKVGRVTLFYACQWLWTIRAFQQSWTGNELAEFTAHHPTVGLPLLCSTPLHSVSATSSCNCDKNYW